MHSMKDKVIVILGASSGIGEATVKLLAGKGAKLVIASRSEEKLKTLADTFPENNVAYKKADVTQFAVRTIMEGLRQEHRTSVSEIISRPTKQAI